MPADRLRSTAAIARDVLALSDLFNGLSPIDGSNSQFKTIVGVLPELNPEHRVNDLHSMLKPAFLDSGQMLGEFYSDCAKTGLRNSEFLPLRSPLPLLVVREMIEFDIAFLADNPRFVRAYLQRHKDNGIEAMQRLLKKNEGISLSEAGAELIEDILSKMTNFEN